MNRKILVMGLPGAGKTTLSRLLARRLNAVHFNADAVRAEISKDLGFSLADRIEHARRMGWLCDQVTATAAWAIADFICPTVETRSAFGEAFVVWVDRIDRGRFEDTNMLFQPPERWDVRVTAAGTAEHWAEKIASTLQPVFDPKKPTAFFLGRYQPFHDGHKALVEEGLRRVGQVCIAVRSTAGTDEKNPYEFEYVKARIEAALDVHAGKFVVLQVPNITQIFYGRDVGYGVERIELAQAIEAISATKVRALIGGESG